MSPGEIVAIDGKTLRRSFDRAAKKAAIHMVSAWAAENRLTLGQVATEEKSNEITAIPRLLELLELNGAIVTIDAMGTQKKIAKKIIDKGADYVLTLKESQPIFHAEVTRFWLSGNSRGPYPNDKSHELRIFENGISAKMNQKSPPPSSKFAELRRLRSEYIDRF